MRSSPCTLTMRSHGAAPPVAESAPVERVQLRVPQATSAPVVRRNPFAFATATRAASRGAESRAERDAGDAASWSSQTSPAPAGPIFTLLGLAITGDTRTAVLGDGQAVHLVKAGEQVGGYQVVDVTESSVTLLDATGVQYVLRLR
jgi:hypothetical protein